MTHKDTIPYPLSVAKVSVLDFAVGFAMGYARGVVEETQSIILLIATGRFGPPRASVDASVREIEDRERLERMTDRLLTATGWEDLLATP
jgi:hypothetical protein